jgi:hypothetical protein
MKIANPSLVKGLVVLLAGMLAIAAYTRMHGKQVAESRWTPNPSGHPTCTFLPEQTLGYTLRVRTESRVNPDVARFAEQGSKLARVESSWQLSLRVLSASDVLDGAVLLGNFVFDSHSKRLPDIGLCASQGHSAADCP